MAIDIKLKLSAEVDKGNAISSIRDFFKEVATYSKKNGKIPIDFKFDAFNEIADKLIDLRRKAPDQFNKIFDTVDAQKNIDNLISDLDKIENKIKGLGDFNIIDKDAIKKEFIDALSPLLKIKSSEINIDNGDFLKKYKDDFKNSFDEIQKIFDKYGRSSHIFNFYDDIKKEMLTNNKLDMDLLFGDKGFNLKFDKSNFDKYMKDAVAALEDEKQKVMTKIGNMSLDFLNINYDKVINSFLSNGGIGGEGTIILTPELSTSFKDDTKKLIDELNLESTIKITPEISATFEEDVKKLLEGVNTKDLSKLLDLANGTNKSKKKNEKITSDKKKDDIVEELLSPEQLSLVKNGYEPKQVNYKKKLNDVITKLRNSISNKNNDIREKYEDGWSKFYSGFFQFGQSSKLNSLEAIINNAITAGNEMLSNDNYTENDILEAFRGLYTAERFKEIDIKTIKQKLGKDLAIIYKNNKSVYAKDVPGSTSKMQKEYAEYIKLLRSQEYYNSPLYMENMEKEASFQQKIDEFVNKNSKFKGITSQHLKQINDNEISSYIKYITDQLDQIELINAQIDNFMNTSVFKSYHGDILKESDITDLKNMKETLNFVNKELGKRKENIETKKDNTAKKDVKKKTTAKKKEIEDENSYDIGINLVPKLSETFNEDVAKLIESLDVDGIIKMNPDINKKEFQEKVDEITESLKLSGEINLIPKLAIDFDEQAQKMLNDLANNGEVTNINDGIKKLLNNDKIKLYIDDKSLLEQVNKIRQMLETKFNLQDIIPEIDISNKLKLAQAHTSISNMINRLKEIKNMDFSNLDFSKMTINVGSANGAKAGLINNITDIFKLWAESDDIHTKVDPSRARERGIGLNLKNGRMTNPFVIGSDSSIDRTIRQGWNGKVSLNDAVKNKKYKGYYDTNVHSHAGDYFVVPSLGGEVTENGTTAIKNGDLYNAIAQYRNGITNYITVGTNEILEWNMDEVRKIFASRSKSSNYNDTMFEKDFSNFVNTVRKNRDDLYKKYFDIGEFTSFTNNNVIDLYNSNNDKYNEGFKNIIRDKILDENVKIKEDIFEKEFDSLFIELQNTFIGKQGIVDKIISSLKKSLDAELNENEINNISEKLNTYIGNYNKSRSKNYIDQNGNPIKTVTEQVKRDRAMKVKRAVDLKTWEKFGLKDVYKLSSFEEFQERHANDILGGNSQEIIDSKNLQNVLDVLVDLYNVMNNFANVSHSINLNESLGIDDIEGNAVTLNSLFKELYNLIVQINTEGVKLDVLNASANESGLINSIQNLLNTYNFTISNITVNDEIINKSIKNIIENISNTEKINIDINKELLNKSIQDVLKNTDGEKGNTGIISNRNVQDELSENWLKDSTNSIIDSADISNLFDIEKQLKEYRLLSKELKKILSNDGVINSDKYNQYTNNDKDPIKNIKNAYKNMYLKDPEHFESTLMAVVRDNVIKSLNYKSLDDFSLDLTDNENFSYIIDNAMDTVKQALPKYWHEQIQKYLEGFKEFGNVKSKMNGYNVDLLKANKNKIIDKLVGLGYGVNKKEDEFFDGLFTDASDEIKNYIDNGDIYHDSLEKAIETIRGFLTVLKSEPEPKNINIDDDIKSDINKDINTTPYVIDVEINSELLKTSIQYAIETLVPNVDIVPNEESLKESIRNAVRTTNIDDIDIKANINIKEINDLLNGINKELELTVNKAILSESINLIINEQKELSVLINKPLLENSILDVLNNNSRLLFAKIDEGSLIKSINDVIANSKINKKIKIDVNKTYFKESIDEIITNNKTAKKLKVDINKTHFKESIDEILDSLKNKTIKLSLDNKNLSDEIDSFLKKYDNKTVKINFDVDEDKLNEIPKEISINVKLSTENIDSEINIGNIKKKLNGLKDLEGFSLDLSTLINSLSQLKTNIDKLNLQGVNLDFLNNLNFTSTNAKNLQKLANAMLNLKTNLNNLSTNGKQFIDDLKDILKYSEELKNLAKLTTNKNVSKQAQDLRKNIDSKENRLKTKAISNQDKYYKLKNKEQTEGNLSGSEIASMNDAYTKMIEAEKELDDMLQKNLINQYSLLEVLNLRKEKEQQLVENKKQYDITNEYNDAVELLTRYKELSDEISYNGGYSNATDIQKQEFQNLATSIQQCIDNIEALDNADNEFRKKIILNTNDISNSYSYNANKKQFEDYYANNETPIGKNIKEYDNMQNLLGKYIEKIGNKSIKITELDSILSAYKKLNNLQNELAASTSKASIEEARFNDLLERTDKIIDSMNFESVADNIFDKFMNNIDVDSRAFVKMKDEFNNLSSVYTSINENSSREDLFGYVTGVRDFYKRYSAYDKLYKKSNNVRQFSTYQEALEAMKSLAKSNYGEIVKEKGDISENANGMAKYSLIIKDATGQVRELGLAWDGAVKAAAVSLKDIGTGRKAGLLGFIDTVGKKIYDISAYMIGIYASPMDWIRYVQNGIQYVREMDTALTEMRKVSDESVESLKRYQLQTFDTAEKIGTTATALQKSTADWLRLGESFKEAQESAKVSNILQNVSEFENIDQATESLVAVSQAYTDLEKMNIVDKLNEVGNNYSISTDQLASGLQKSSATLSLMGNTIDETAALITAGELYCLNF